MNVTDRATMQAVSTDTATNLSGQFGTTSLPYEYDGLGRTVAVHLRVPEFDASVAGAMKDVLRVIALHVVKESAVLKIDRELRRIVVDPSALVYPDDPDSDG